MIREALEVKTLTKDDKQYLKDEDERQKMIQRYIDGILEDAQINFEQSIHRLNEENKQLMMEKEKEDIYIELTPQPSLFLE